MAKKNKDSNFAKYCQNNRSLLLSEWDYQKNNSVLPSTVSPYSNKKVWWKCQNGHEWQAVIASRVNGTGCPYCSGNNVITGVNDLATANPELAADWNYEKNGTMKPSVFFPGSNKKVWWLGKCGHEWQATIYSRNTGVGCPICSGKKVLSGFNDLATTNHKLAEEWNHSKNKGLTPSMVCAGSSQKVWWIDKFGHEWQASISSRNSGRGCPICSNRIIVKGINDLATVNPSIAKEWDYTRNGNLTPFDVSFSSGLKIWWKCSNGHVWQCSVNGRSNNRGCPFCANKKILVGYNDLFTTNPELASEWDYKKNKELDPQKLNRSSKLPAWWICPKGHSYQTKIHNRGISHSGCPICTHKELIHGMADLKTVNPNLSSEWNYNKNAPLKPSDVFANSDKKVWWICPKGHEWQASIVSRNRGTGCPYCSNRKILIGFNDFAHTHPELVKYWNNDRNGSLKPTDITYGSSKKVWFKCELGHEWKSNPVTLSAGSRCPICDWHNRTSFTEQAFFYYIRTVFPDAQNGNRTVLSGKELDIYLPSIALGIEFDGYWHQDIKRDIQKNNLCKTKGIALWRIRDPLCPHMQSYDNVTIYTFKDIYKDSGLEKAIRAILSALGQETTVDIEKDRNKIYSLFLQSKRKNSLDENQDSILLTEWNYDKNGSLSPLMFTQGTNYKLWWKCQKGHEWQASVASRVRGTGCPICANQKVQSGYNDLLALCPELAKEWNYDKNGGITPEDVMPQSNLKVWWLGKCGHEWKASVYNRANGSGCPICAGRLILPGTNDFFSLRPDLQNEWIYEKNTDIDFSKLSKSSRKKVWWKCSQGHEYTASIFSRCISNTGCPICANRIIQDGFNDFASQKPKLAREWNYAKNGDLKPNQVTAGSSKKVWWIGLCGHEWQATIVDRSQGRGCPFCSNRKVLKGFNDLATQNPSLSAEWNYQKNQSLTPFDVSSKSHKIVWWRCSNGHEWQATIASRSRGTSCPLCSIAKSRTITHK